MPRVHVEGAQASKPGAREDSWALAHQRPGLAYSFAIILRTRNERHGINEEAARQLHRALVRALLDADIRVGVLVGNADTCDSIVLVADAAPRSALPKEEFSSPSLITLLKERARLKSDLVDLPLDESSLETLEEDILSPAEELVLTSRILQRCLNRINIDEHGDACTFDVTIGGGRSTPLEFVVEDVFPLQDEHFNESFLRSLSYPASAFASAHCTERLRSRARHIWRKWIWQTTKSMGGEEIRLRYGDRVASSIEFIFHYRSCVLGLAALSTSNYFLVRFASWDLYVFLLGCLGVFTCCVWGPWLARRWTLRFYALARQWRSRHVLVPPGSVQNPHVPAAFHKLPLRQRQRRRPLVSALTMLVVFVNILVLVPVSLIFTQWYVFGKHAPTCECCEFLLFETGIGNGTQAMTDVPRSAWPSACYDEYFAHRQENPLMLATQPSDCSYWRVCFSHAAATVGTDRWVYILCQGIVMGLLLDVLQTQFFRALTFWLTKHEGHETLEEFHKFFVRKSFFFTWLNMFVWYLTITFLYVPFGARIQDWLVDAGHAYIVPPWGWRAEKIRLDEAFVTPVIVTAFVNGALETFVPARIARLTMRAKAAKRKLLDLSGSARIMDGHEGVRNPGPSRPAVDFYADLRAELADQVPSSSKGGWTSEDTRISGAEVIENMTEQAAKTLGASSREGSETPEREAAGTSGSDAPNNRLGSKINERLRLFETTPDRSQLNAEEILLQAAMPRFSEHDDYLNIVIQMGYVCMFTSAWGLLPLAAWCRLLFSFRGTCYRLMFASKRSVPLSALETPGEWLSAFYVTIWLAMPVICAQISLSTGALDVAYRIFGLDDRCALDMAEKDDMIPDWKGCAPLSLQARVLVACFLEHICVAIFAYTYLSTNQSASLSLSGSPSKRQPAKARPASSVD